MIAPGSTGSSLSISSVRGYARRIAGLSAALARSQGAIINILSLAALASVRFSPADSISRVAAFSLTQSLRALSAARGVKVHALLAGPVDPDMARHLDLPKTSPELVAGVFDRLEKGEEEILPDPMSQSITEGSRNGIAKALEQQFAAFLPDTASA
jgi:NAD(P)-dependent dehydrogenase (short-subunit alcohol dehydrogenase family)